MIELIQQRLDGYRASNPVAEEQALKEILQEVALYALWRAGFFEAAAFEGGTSLRIPHQLPRFSEDLDFILKEPDPGFDWNHYREQLVAGLQEFGLQSEVLDRSSMDQTVRKALLKDDSIGRQLNLAFYQGYGEGKIRITLQIDVNPPSGAAVPPLCQRARRVRLQLVCETEGRAQPWPPASGAVSVRLLKRPAVDRRRQVADTCLVRKDCGDQLETRSPGRRAFSEWHRAAKPVPLERAFFPQPA